MQRAALYVRVSTDDQTEFSPDAQVRALNDYASKNKILVEKIFIDEGVSARTSNRPAFQDMIKLAKTKPKPFDLILVHKFDRFARNREDSVVFKSLLRKECGIKVISITEQLEDDKFSVILEAMLEAMAEYYSLNLSDEVKKGMSEKARKGGFLARPPYGYRVEEETKPPVVIPDQAEVVKLIFDKFINEKWSYVKITTYLNEMNLKTEKGYPFSTSRVKYIINNPFYCGIIRWNMRDSTKGYKYKSEDEWIISEGEHEPIISKELYEKVQSRLKTLKFYGKSIEFTKNEYSGLLRCVACGGSMHYSRRISNGKNQPYFKCNYYPHICKSGGNSAHISVRKLEKALMKKIQDDFSTNEIIKVVDYSDNTPTELAILEAQLEKFQDKYIRIKAAYEKGVDSLEEYAQNKSRIREEEESVKKRILELNAQDSEKSTSDKFKENLKLIYDKLNSDIDMEEKKRLLHSFIKQIVVDKENQLLTVTYKTE